MSPLRRRILSAVLFETGAVIVVALAFTLLLDGGPGLGFGVAAASSVIAMLWNLGWNWLFERWESRNPVKGRSFLRRTCHAVGFEGGLLIVLAPLYVLAFGITLLEAVLFDLGFSAFFVVYAWAFTWSFDRIFGLPASAR